MELKARIRYVLKKAVYSNTFLYQLVSNAKKLVKRLPKNGNCKIENEGFALIKKDIEGEGHCIRIKKGCLIKGTTLHIRGKNNQIVFEENCYVGENCSFWMEGNDISIIIGSGTTFTHTVHFCAQEDGVSIEVGEDCMFSNNIIVRTSDSHPIYDMQTNTRINPPQDVVIGKHVWIAPHTKVMKGAVIGDGAIIGSDTMVSKCIPSNSLAVGHPAKVVKNDIKWTRERLF